MNILHYALGFPPYRSGGLTKFCIDLMEQQSKEGHSVAMLWPGEIKLINKSVAIKINKNVRLRTQSIQSFELINPLPVSFDEGIVDIIEFTKNAGEKAYECLIDSFQPDVIHVHTLMGIHKSFFEVAKAKKIRLVFTAHDFFPICPKVTMFRHGAICRNIKNCEDCGVCNSTALSLKKIKILQSPIYRVLKNSYFVKKLRKQHRDNYLSEATADDSAEPLVAAEQYKELRDYYYSLLKMMDIIHYNSNITKKVYETFFSLQSNCTIAITHSDIQDKRKLKDFSKGKIHIRYLGPQSGAKGFFLLKDALDELWNEHQNFCLDIHFEPVERKSYMRVHNRYSYKELNQIFNETDILVVPSIWYETFGFTVLEALSYGVPVVVSGTVGAKDILFDGAGIIVSDITPSKLCEILHSLKKDDLEKMNSIIVERQPIIQMKEMSKQIEAVCYGWKQ